MDLFDYMRETKMESEAPLASRIRPRTLDEIVGQQHILAKDKLLYRAIKADKFRYFLRTAGNRKDNDRKSDRRHNECGFYADQCYGGR